LLLGLAAGPSPILGSEESRTENVVALPPFLVEAELLDGPHWLHGECSGLEILSAGEEDETQAFIQDLRTDLVYLHQLIPEEFLFHTALPSTLILFPRSLTATMDKEMAQELYQIPATSRERSRFEPMFDLRLSDPDSTYTFAILRDYQWEMNRSQGRHGPPIVCSPAYVRFLLESRAPALPAWYRVGISGLYESSLFSELQPGLLFRATVSTASKSSYEDRIDGFEPDPWLSERAAMVLRSDAGAPRPLLPMREVFVPSIPVASRKNTGVSGRHNPSSSCDGPIQKSSPEAGTVSGASPRRRRPSRLPKICSGPVSG